MKHNSKAAAGRTARWSVGVAISVLGVAACSSSSEGTSTTVAPTIAVTAGGGASAVTDATTASTVEVSEAPTSASTTGAPPTAATSTATTTSTVAPTTVPPTTIATTTTFPLLTQGGIVIVANASGVDGAAAGLSTALGNLGFQTVKATNAAGYEGKLDASKVYFTGDGYPSAYSLAQLLGGLEVAAMPTPPPIQNALEGLRGANVIVMLGGDLAGKTPPGAPEETTTTAPPIT